jgi:hypothetical protein
MAAKKSKGMDTGTKVVIGVLAVALLLSVMNGSSDDDGGDSAGADTSEESADAASGAAAGADDAGSDDDSGDDGGDSGDYDWSGDAAPTDDGDDDSSSPPADDPWTRGSDAGRDDGDDGDDDAAPVDDPWTRGGPSGGGGGGLPACRGVASFRIDEGTVTLPIDSEDDAFASSDCTFGRGQADESVWLVQAALNQCNGQAAPVDGVNGSTTQQAVAAVQAARGLSADGAYGPDTRAAMAWPVIPDEDDDGAAPAVCVQGPDVG